MKSKKDYLLVDGYNIIYAWSELNKLLKDSLHLARVKLIEILSDYQGVKKNNIIIVFDAHLQNKTVETFEKHQNINVVYTRASQTADEYIERFTSENAKNLNITVATSDYLEQIIIIGRGGSRISARDLLLDIKKTKEEIRDVINKQKPIKNNLLIDNLDPEMASFLDNLRLNN